MQKKTAEQQCKSLWSISAASQKPSPLLHSSLLLIHLGLLRMRQPLRPLSKTSDEVDENIVLQISSTEQERKERHRIPREDDILPYRHLNISAYPDPIQSFNSSFFTLHYYLFTCCCCERYSSFAPPLPLSKTSALPNLPKTFFSLRRQAKLHAEGASLSACGKHHSPKANIAVQLLRQLHLGEPRSGG